MLPKHACVSRRPRLMRPAPPGTQRSAARAAPANVCCLLAKASAGSDACRNARNMKTGFVDIHSHVCPSGDDGARSVKDAIELCRVAAAYGTSLLYATPHVMTHPTSYPLDEERERTLRAVHAELRATVAEAFAIELRLGYELAPGTDVEGGYRRVALQDTDAVLVEAPGPWFGLEPQLDFEVLVGECARIEREGLVPVVAHPERCESIIRRPKLALVLAERGWPLQVNAQSLTGEHGKGPCQTAWTLLRLGLGDFVGSDGHDLRARPPRLDLAYEAVRDELGVERADALFRGGALDRLSRLAAVRCE